MYHILELLRSSRIVSNIEILHLVDEEDIQALSVKAALSDESLLYVRELTTKTDTKYSYHWQTKTGKLFCRWDNAPHHKTLHTFPHHKHIRTSKSVLPSTEVTLEKILKNIEKQVANSYEIRNS